MDDKWFKKQQKIAGITAEDIAARLGRDRSLVSRIYVGRQRMTLDQARVFADVLSVPLDEVLRRAGLAGEDVVQAVVAPALDGDAIPWKPNGGDSRKIYSIVAAMGGGPGIDVWKIRGRSMTQAGLLPGDFLLVDTAQSERVVAGDVVVAEVFQRSSSQVVLRRWAPPVLVPAHSPGDDEPVYIVDNVNVAIRGKVVASWRI